MESLYFSTDCFLYFKNVPVNKLTKFQLVLYPDRSFISLASDIVRLANANVQVKAYDSRTIRDKEMFYCYLYVCMCERDMCLC